MRFANVRLSVVEYSFIIFHVIHIIYAFMHSVYLHIPYAYLYIPLNFEYFCAFLLIFFESSQLSLFTNPIDVA